MDRSTSQALPNLWERARLWTREEPWSARYCAELRWRGAQVVVVVVVMRERNLQRSREAGREALRLAMAMAMAKSGRGRLERRVRFLVQGLRYLGLRFRAFSVFRVYRVTV
jgi:hypothetical protein